MNIGHLLITFGCFFAMSLSVIHSSEIKEENSNQKIEKLRKYWQRLSPEKRDHYRQLFGQWQTMSEADRLKVAVRYKQFRQLPKEKRVLAMQRFRAFQNLAPDKKEVIAQKVRKFHQLEDGGIELKAGEKGFFKPEQGQKQIARDRMNPSGSQPIAAPTPGSLDMKPEGITIPGGSQWHPSQCAGGGCTTGGVEHSEEIESPPKTPK